MTGAAVEVVGLTRDFTVVGRMGRRGRTVTALAGLDLTIADGEIVGLLGPNGAGKTTLVKVLSTVLLPTSGTVTVFGNDVVRHAAAVRPMLGIVLGGERGLYTRLTARQNLRYWGALYHLDGATARKRTDELLERVGLSERADDRSMLEAHRQRPLLVARVPERRIARSIPHRWGVHPVA